MKFAARDPNCGYRDNWLWLPRRHVSAHQISSALTYDNPRGSEPVRSWHIEPHHYRVPRNFIDLETLSALPYPVYDTTFRDFPRVELKSRVVLDFMEPDKTYQRDGSAALLRCVDGILCLRCGAGKTVTALHTAVQANVPILIGVDEIGLAHQWVEEIEEWLGLSKQEIGLIGGDGAKFDWEHAVTVATLRTLASRVAAGTLPSELVQHAGVFLIDEAHVAGAPYINTAVPPFHGRRWGLSATPRREDGFDPLLTNTIGRVVYSYLTPDLVPRVLFRRIATRINMADPKVFAATHDTKRNFHFGMTYGYLAVAAPDRFRIIAQDIRDALSEGREILVLTHSVDMAELLGSEFPEAGVISGRVKGKERLRRIKECNPVIGIVRLGKQALNKPKLDTMMICEPFTKEGVVQQVMGRALRKFAGKKKPIVVFYEDETITPLSRMCAKLRSSLARWPQAKGGAIPFSITRAEDMNGSKTKVG